MEPTAKPTEPTLMRRKARPPSRRRLRAFAFDPSLNLSLESAVINQVVIQVPWEETQPGPVGEYLEVIDADPASGVFYPPLDLSEPYLLAQDGLAPAEGNPQFHQQMVYAVAMNTIDRFEKALGRAVLWSESEHDPDRFVEKLRVYPHALREANAFYSPYKKALLFGYFPAPAVDPANVLPGGMVFTCLSHDIIVHETTHALLDGMHRLFIEPSNVDVLAFHEAFADIVALFQHFTYSEVLYEQVARTRGDLTSENLLGQLAQQFGQAIGNRGALRDAIGHRDPETGEWQRKKPDPAALDQLVEPHSRGAILVTAVFDAFLAMYKARIADLLRIATGGSGVLPPGEIHPDLVNRLAAEVTKTAGHVLNICIRALDYCPPVDLNYGDYLRAMITADVDAVSDDKYSYRTAFIEAFRRYGIYPHDVRSLSADSLVWRPPAESMLDPICQVLGGPDFLQQLTPKWVLESDRAAVHKQCSDARNRLQQRFNELPDEEWVTSALNQLWLAYDKEVEKVPRSVDRHPVTGRPNLQVESVRPAYRITPGGNAITDLVISIIQQRRGYLDEKVQESVDDPSATLEASPKNRGSIPHPDFWLRGGCTMLVDPLTCEVRYSIGKRVVSSRRLREQRQFLKGVAHPSLRMTYFSDQRSFYTQPAAQERLSEPFALLHRM